MKQRLKSEDGVSLLELVIAGAIASLIALIAFAALEAVGRADTHTSDDSRALAAMRAATQRFTKELRQAGKVYDSSTASRVEFWVDYNRNTQQENTERIVWKLVTIDGTAQFARTTLADEISGQPSEPWVVGDLLIEPAFSYVPDPPSTSLVTIRLAADVNPDRGGPPRRVETHVRLRNAPS